VLPGRRRFRGRGLDQFGWPKSCERIGRHAPQADAAPRASREALIFDRGLLGDATCVSEGPSLRSSRPRSPANNRRPASSPAPPARRRRPGDLTVAARAARRAGGPRGCRHQGECGRCRVLARPPRRPARSLGRSRPLPRPPPVVAEDAREPFDSPARIDGGGGPWFTGTLSPAGWTQGAKRLIGEGVENG